MIESSDLAVQPPFCKTDVSGSLHSGKLVLDACCGGRMFWYEKENQNVLFMDKREVDKVLDECKLLNYTQPNDWIGYNAFNEVLHNDMKKTFESQRQIDSNLFKSILSLSN